MTLSLGTAVSVVASGVALLILAVWLTQTDVQEDTYCTWGWCQTECQSSVPQVQPGGKRRDSAVSFVPPSSILQKKPNSKQIKKISCCCVWLENRQHAMASQTVWRRVISRFMANVCKYAVYTLDHVTRIVSGCYRGESPGQWDRFKRVTSSIRNSTNWLLFAASGARLIRSPVFWVHQIHLYGLLLSVLHKQVCSLLPAPVLRPVASVHVPKCKCLISISQISQTAPYNFTK